MPYAVFSFHFHNAQKLVFIAGGIGITPFISMLQAIYEQKLDKKVTLFWGNKTEKDIVFKGKIDRMASELPGLKIVHVLSRQDDWKGEKGRINKDILEKHLNGSIEGEFFICGPPKMMEDVKKDLKSLEVHGKRIHMERFALR